MNKIRKVLIMSIVLLLINACTKNQDSELIGEWQGIDVHTGRTLTLVFEENEKVTMIDESLVLEGTWNINTKTEKEIFDLDLNLKRGTETIKSPMILRFLTKDKIQLKMSKDSTNRPTEFSSNKDKMQIVMKKQ